MDHSPEFEEALKLKQGSLADKKYDETPLRRYPTTEDQDFFPVDPFNIDEAKITASKAFRRLPHKVQVFPSPLNPNVRTRLSHTMEVTAVSTTIAAWLGLNVNLCRVIALGHDLGHPPFGHKGEEVITNLSEREYGQPKVFQHHVYSVVVAQRVERKEGRGLNLTFPTLEGIINHSRSKGKDLIVDRTLPDEYAVVMFADKIAYTFSDLNDAVRMGAVEKKDFPPYFDFKRNQRWLTAQCIGALVAESAEKGEVSFEESNTAQALADLRKYMFTQVYLRIDERDQEAMLTRVYELFKRSDPFAHLDPLIVLSLLTDHQVITLNGALSTHMTIGRDFLKDLGVSEVLEYLRGRKIDYADPELHREDFVYGGK